jgi:N4-gp56 family major capsid protein
MTGPRTFGYGVTACKKTELGVQPGLTVNFARYNNLPSASQLVEGVRMQTNALAASMFSITVAEHGMAIAVSELLLNSSFDDVMATASRLLGRNMAMWLDQQSRDTLLQASSVLYGYNKMALTESSRTPLSPYDLGSAAASTSALTGAYGFTTGLTLDITETLATKNVPRIGDSYVTFVHPHQSRVLREDPSWIEVTKYAQPGQFMIGEIGRINDQIFVETTQVTQISNGNSSNPATVYEAISIGDNAFGHAISLPVELRDGGVLDFGREHALAWYAIWGLGLITDQAVVISQTN